jgi:SpoVK/Ycf46/Vps4 family AAA+-type ATPase
MSSSGKKKTTMAKLARESRLRERRMLKAAKKNDRKLGLLDPPDEPAEALEDASGVSSSVVATDPALDDVAEQPPAGGDETV